MRILQVHNRYREQGGEDGVAEREAEALESRGHVVERMLFDNPGGPATAASLIVSSHNLRSARRMEADLNRFDPDIVHAHNTWFAATSAVIRVAHRRVPVVQTLHNYRLACLNSLLFRDGQLCTTCVGTHVGAGILGACYRGSVAASLALAVATHVDRLTSTHGRSVDRHLVLSEFAADIARQSGVPADRIFRHDNYVADPGSRLISPEQSNRVLGVGRLAPEKGFDPLIRAWTKSRPEGLDLVIVGEGPERRSLERLADDSVAFLGRRSSDEVRRLMLSSRALVFPSRWVEGQPLVLLEALAAGLPVIASSHPPIDEILRPAGQVLVADDEWGTTLRRLTEDEWLAGASAMARRRWSESYTERVAVDRLEHVYAAAVSERRSAPGV